MSVLIGCVNLRNYVSAVNDDFTLISGLVTVTLFPVVFSNLNTGRECLLFGSQFLASACYWLLRLCTAFNIIRSLFTFLVSSKLFCFCSALAFRNGSFHECLLFFGGCISEMFVYIGEYFFF